MSIPNNTQAYRKYLPGCYDERHEMLFKYFDQSIHEQLPHETKNTQNKHVNSQKSMLYDKQTHL